MLNWLFKKRGGAAARETAASVEPGVQARGEAKGRLSEDARSAWLDRLQAAGGDDAALLRVALGAPLLELKLAAVEALRGEAALKQAEREFRNHDRRVHRLAKHRLAQTVAQREARARANALIELATALSGEALLPANRLVALDLDWHALDTNMLEPAQVDRFAALRDSLDRALRERGEQQRDIRRWTADASRALADLRSACAQAAATGVASDITAHREAAQALQIARPDAAATAALDHDLLDALQDAAAVDARLAWLQAQEHDCAAATPGPTTQLEFEDPADTAPGVAAATVAGTHPARHHEPVAAQRWRALVPTGDPALSSMLDKRFDQWQRRQAPARPPRPGARNAPIVHAVADGEQRSRLEALLQSAEAALAEGQVSNLQRRLQALQAALESTPQVARDDALRARHQALQAELARLKAWQQWGGERARDDLMAEADDLARRAVVASEPDAAESAKLHLKTHGQAIRVLRARWKELDRTGAAASQAMWQRFDAALQTAHEPVAAQHAVLKAEREANLQAREALLAELDALPVDVDPPDAEDVAAQRKEHLRALDRFHLAWRKLGPLEHTVPAAARADLQRHARESVDRVERPLQQARRGAEIEREQLIARAEALREQVRRDPALRDAPARVRELQAAWQQHARGLPLARAAEAALWARFKAATDAVFAQRDAAASEHEAAWAANLAAREAVLERLAALGPDASADDTRRTLADADRAWRQAAELPRGTAGAIEARFRDARAAALKRLAGADLERRQSLCDALAAKLTLCEQREDGSAAASDLASGPSAGGALPAAWDEALGQRWSLRNGPGPLSASEFDDLLLELEAALDQPVAPAQAAARRDLKLRALKDALEGRAAAAHDPARTDRWLAAALRQSQATRAQRERLHALIKAMRQMPHGLLLGSESRG